jgi:hypothetical protein
VNIKICQVLVHGVVAVRGKLPHVKKRGAPFFLTERSFGTMLIYFKSMWCLTAVYQEIEFSLPVFQYQYLFV